MRKFCFLILVFILGSCDSDEMTIDVVVEQTEFGAILRTIDRINPDFEHTNFQSTFSIVVEEQDEEEGLLFDFLRLFVQYVDRSPENGLSTTQELILRDIPASDFEIGPNGFPRDSINIVYQDAIDLLNLDATTISIGDQFMLGVEIHLTDGRTFSNEDGSSRIFTDACSFKSPYRYVINVIDPIDDALFTGVYRYEIIEGEEDPRFELPFEGIVTITTGNTSNVRRTGIIGEGLEFTIAGSNVYPKIYQSFGLLCRMTFFRLITGPDEENFGQVDITDDSVFDLDIIFGYEGLIGAEDLGTPIPYKFRFSKQ